MYDYWSQHPLLGVPGITSGMSRNRFRDILKNLHLNDNSKMPSSGQPNYDRLYKVRPLLESVRKNNQKAYTPTREVSVDEAMVLFKGRSSIKQYMPMKPTKRGYKVWCLCDSANRYLYDFDVYTGASVSQNEDGGLGARFVKTMVKELKGKGYHVYMDNFFTSVALAEALMVDQTFVIGTARSNRKKWPSNLKNLKVLQKTMQRGDRKSVLLHDGKIECLIWKDHTTVPLINTITDSAKHTTVKRTNKDGSRTDVTCPESIKRYNKHMGGVDLFDSRRETYSCSRKSKKWWLRFFYFLVDAAVTKPISYTETLRVILN